MLAQLGFPIAAPLVQENVGTALEFFDCRMPTLNDATKLGFLRGMDLHKEVRPEWLHSGSQVAAFRRAGEPLFKLFYTKPGTSPHHLGIVPLGRKFHRFHVRQPVEALASRAADFIYASADDATAGLKTWALPGGGGGLQYIIPDADRFLEIVASPLAVSNKG